MIRSINYVNLVRKLFMSNMKRNNKTFFKFLIKLITTLNELICDDIRVYET